MKHSYPLQKIRTAIATFCILLLSAIAAHAQITLTQASYAGWSLGLDSTSTISSFTAAPSNNATWDLTGATYGTPTPFTRTAVSGNATYPSATYSIPSFYSFNALLGYQATDMNGLNASGIQGYGQTVPRQPISLFTLTANALDSLVFIQQNIVYSGNKNILSFPATSTSAWGSAFIYDLAFTLSVASYSLASAPGKKRGYVTYTDTVKGWGKMRVKTATGGNSVYMDVLAVKIAYVQKDSFFLNGLPAPAALVTAFGLTQGMLSGQYYISYYRAGQAQPLLSVAYTDNTYSSMSGATAHSARLSQATGVPIITAGDRYRLSPNPVSDGAVNIEITDPGIGTYQFEMINGFGQKVAGSTLPLNNGKASLHLDQSGGIYYLNVLKDGQSLGTRRLNILP